MRLPSNFYHPAKSVNAVRDLENEMGIEIFIRNPKGITLTKDGMEFLSITRQVVEQTQL